MLLSSFVSRTEALNQLPVYTLLISALLGSILEQHRKAEFFLLF